MTDAPKRLPDQAWLCNDRFWHIAGEHEFTESTLYVRADTRPAVTLADALAVPEVAALVARMDKITKHEYASRDQMILNCALGQITLGDIADLCAALSHIKGDR